MSAEAVVTHVRPKGWAKTVTDVLSPAHIVIVLPLVVGWHATAPALSGLAWGACCAVLCGVVPYAFIIQGVRRRKLSDIHMRERRHRYVPIAVTLLCLVADIVLLRAGGAPRDLDAMLAAMLATLALIGAVTTRWKISAHTAVSGGALGIAAVCISPWILLLAPFVALIATARVVLRDHTTAQVLAGCVLGAVVAPLVQACLS